MFNGFVDSLLSVFSRDSVIQEVDSSSDADSSLDEEVEISSSSSEDMIIQSYRSSDSETTSVEGANLDMDCITTDAAPRLQPSSKPIDFGQTDVFLIEKQLEIYEKVSLIFMLYDHPFKALEQVTILLQDPTRMVLKDWYMDMNRTDNNQWKEKIVEAMAVIQNYELPKKILGLDRDQLNARFLPNVHQICVHIQKSRKILYKICEALSSTKTNELIKLVQSDQASKGFIFKPFNHPYLELYFLHWEHLNYIGPNNFRSLYKIFKHLGELDICEIIDQLSPSKITNEERKTDIGFQKNYDNPVPPVGPQSLNTSTDNAERESYVSQMSVIDDGRYDIDPRNPGVCLIINQEYFYKEVDPNYKHLLSKLNLEIRSGTQQDKDALKQVFESYGFQTRVEENLTHTRIQSVIKDVINSLEDHSSLFICIMSHGEEGVIYGVNSCLVKVEEIQKMIAKAKKLRGKPKILLLQSCQGNKCQKIDGDSDDEIQLDGGGGKSVPGTADMLTYWATVPGYGAIRHKTTGSWFVQSFCENIRSNGRTCHLQDICTRINNDVTNKTWQKGQEEVTMVPVIINTLRKNFYFPSV